MEKMFRDFPKTEGIQNYLEDLEKYLFEHRTEFGELFLELFQLLHDLASRPRPISPRYLVVNEL
jgi:hypothetical protein